MKKIIITVLLLTLCTALCVALFGCDDKKNPTPDNPPVSDGASNTPPTGNNQGGEQSGTGNQGGEQPEPPKDPTEGLEYTLNEDGESYSVTGIGTATDTDIVIAATYEGKPVTSIGDYAFVECSNLTSIVIPASVTSIGSGAFGRCSSLTSIEVPTSVTSIGSYAFGGCSSLTSIEIPSSVTSIGDYAINRERDMRKTLKITQKSLQMIV